MTADHTCAGCACQAEHDGDYGASGRPGPCPPHTCSVTADHTPERLSAEEREALRRDLDDVISSNATWAVDPITSQVDAALEVAEEHLERILAAHLADVEARLAAVEALVNDLDPPWRVGGPNGCGVCLGHSPSWDGHSRDCKNEFPKRVRAALHPQDPDQERTSG